MRSGSPILEEIFRDQWAQVLAALIGFLGDFDLAEEAAQEAFAVAAERWPRDGAPASPNAWLVTTARNRAIDRIRRDRTLAAKTRLLGEPEAAQDRMDATTFPDERLELVFTCCHPALATDAQVALTLRSLGGLTTGEIARAFLVGEPTELARLTDSPVVELSRAVAVAEAGEPAAGLAIVDRLGLEDYRYLPATRAELLRRLGRTAETREAYRRALELVHDPAERRFLERRLAELDTPASTLAPAPSHGSSPNARPAGRGRREQPLPRA